LIRTLITFLKLFFQNTVLKYKLFRDKENGPNLKHHGFKVVKNALKKEECLALQSKIDHLIEDEQYDWTDASDFRIYQAQQYAELAILNTAFKNADNLAKLFHGSEYHYTDLIARIKYKHGNKGSGGGWHKDSPYPQFKSIIYLSDATESNGVFQIIPGSQKFFSNLKTSMKLKKAPFDKRYSETEVSLLNIDTLSIVGSAGDQIFVNTNSIHRGKPLKNGMRYAVTRYYFNTSDQKESFLKSL